MIVKQGERGDTFYIIKVGSVLVTKRTQESLVEETVCTLRKGDFFGELALLREDCRQASVIAQAPGVECLTLDRKYVFFFKKNKIKNKTCLVFFSAILLNILVEALKV